MTLYPDSSVFPGAGIFPGTTVDGLGPYVFSGVTIQRRIPIMAGLAALINFSAALLRIDGEWVETEFPSEQQLAAADLYFPGGYDTVVDTATADLLIASGYTVVDLTPS
jgi:hypothetical protein